MKQKINKSGGYIAISSVLVILAVTLTIFMSVALMSVDGAQISLSENQSQKAIYMVESCATEVLLYLNNNNSLPTSIALPEGSCTVAQDSHVGENWVFTTSGTIDGFSKSIMLDVNRNATIVVNSWKEI